MKSTLFIAAILASSLAFTNAAEKSPISGELSVGWDNYYSYNNVVPAGSMASAATTIGVAAQYEIPGACDIVAKFTNSNLSQTTGLTDATTFFAGVKGQPQWAKGDLTLSFGYELLDGGLPGLWNTTAHGMKRHNGNGCDMAHTVRFDMAYNIPTSAWQFVGSAAYSMHDNDGWLMSCGLNYTVNVCEKLTVIFGGDVTFSQDFIRLGDQKFNGTDGYKLFITAPYKATDKITVAPYIAAVWSGHNVVAVNKLTNGAFKNFAPMAGVTVSYSF